MNASVIRRAGFAVALGTAVVLAACGGAGRAGSAAAGPSIAFLPGDIAITDVTVVPMSRDGELAHHTVVVRGDRIVAVAPSASIAPPAGTTTIAGDHDPAIGRVTDQ